MFSTKFVKITNFYLSSGVGNKTLLDFKKLADLSRDFTVVDVLRTTRFSCKSAAAPFRALRLNYS